MELTIDNKKYQVTVIYKKVKRIFLKITNTKEIIITSPVKLSEAAVNDIINSHIAWITKKIQLSNEIDLRDDEVLLFGKIYKLVIDNEITNDYYIKDDIIYYHNNGLTKLYNDSFVKIANIFAEINKTYKLKVKPYLQYRKMKTRWGVCHYSSGKIVLNKILISVPIELIKYVIFHEFTHFYVPNHSTEFYSCLSKAIPNHKALKKSLKKYQFLL